MSSCRGSLAVVLHQPPKRQRAPDRDKGMSVSGQRYTLHQLIQPSQMYLNFHAFENQLHMYDIQICNILGMFCTNELINRRSVYCAYLKQLINFSNYNIFLLNSPPSVCVVSPRSVGATGDYAVCRSSGKTTITQPNTLCVFAVVLH